VLNAFNLIINTFYNDNDPPHSFKTGVNNHLRYLQYTITILRFLIWIDYGKTSGNKPIVDLNVNKYSINNMNLYSENDLLIIGTKPIRFLY
jgi:hypothetical protein